MSFERAMKYFYTLAFWITGSVLIGFGTNWMVGLGVFFAIWAIAGLTEL